MPTLFKSTISFIIAIFVLVPFKAQAITFNNPLGDVSVEALIENIINWIMWTVVAVAPIMFSIAAFYLLSSGGDPAKTKKARQIFFYTLIGLFLALLAKGIVFMVKQALGVS